MSCLLPKVSNTLQWLGSNRQQVLIDNILIKCVDLSSQVYKKSTLGPNMIHDLGEGMSICVYRKLHDPSKSIPVYQVRTRSSSTNSPFLQCKCEVLLLLQWIEECRLIAGLEYQQEGTES